LAASALLEMIGMNNCSRRSDRRFHAQGTASLAKFTPSDLAQRRDEG
jgi:hypothetical protein